MRFLVNLLLTAFAVLLLIGFSVSPAPAQDRQFYEPGYYFPPVPYAQPMGEYQPRPVVRQPVAPARVLNTAAFDRVAVAWSACLERMEARILPNSDGAAFADTANRVMFACAEFEHQGVEALQEDGLSYSAAERRMRSLANKARQIVFADMDKRLTERR